MEGKHTLRSRIQRIRAPLAAGVLGITLLSLAVGMTVSSYHEHRNDERAALRQAAASQAQALDNYFARARALTKLLAHNPAYSDFYATPGTRLQKVGAQVPAVRQANGSLSYLEQLYPNSIGEACFIDQSGSENARAVRGLIAPKNGLSTQEAKTSFFAPTFAIKPGQVYQAEPYISPDTAEWVIANSTQVATGRPGERAIVHFEVTIESFRRELAKAAGDNEIAVVDVRTGHTVISSDHPQPDGGSAPLGPPDTDRYAALSDPRSDDLQDVDHHMVARAPLDFNPYNANNWVVVAASNDASPTWLNSLGLTQFGVIGGAALLLAFALLSFRSSQRTLRDAADTDPLTSLGNRRKLTSDLRARIASATKDCPLILVLFDLDGFKDYNDTFGHPAGDALLVRLADNLASSLKGKGTAYRMGGDEFCVLAPDVGDDHEALLEAARVALSERGDGFEVTASQGWVELPTETTDSSEALRLADQRMYANKAGSRASAGRQSTDVLVRVLAERYPELGQHLSGVATLCEQVAERMGLPHEQRIDIVQAASLHDLGKVAVPDTVLEKPSQLDETEWAFIRQHTLIGERILSAAPALARASKLVRWSHERYDGTGYPDGIAGDKIPLGARIIFACDAYDAMTSDRPYAEPRSSEEALEELQRCAGSQFDPDVVEAFVAVMSEPGRHGAGQKTLTLTG
jgi:diguanylate cyclase (GGDEF)-like protein